MSRLLTVSGIVSAAIIGVVLAVGIWMRSPLEMPEPPATTAIFMTEGPRLPPGTPPDLRRRVFLDVNASAPATVFRTLSRTIGATLTLDPGVTQPVTVRVSNVTAGTALSAICESIGCRWQLTGTDLQVDASAAPPPIPAGEILSERLRRPLPRTRFSSEPFVDALKTISDQSGIAFTVDDVDPTARITVDVTDDEPLIAVFKIIRAAGWNFTGSGRFDIDQGKPAIHLVPDKRLR